MSKNTPQNPKRELTDAEVCDILTQAMADVGAGPDLVYAFKKTGVYGSAENVERLSAKSLDAFDGAVDDYESALKRPVQ
ncbi:MAG TPA: hypothetical protein VM120_17145 [Bryobacteraceae bacterium]|nr:hypothetical protein [Bryobacteraceae bacterium]